MLSFSITVLILSLFRMLYCWFISYRVFLGYFAIGMAFFALIRSRLYFLYCSFLYLDCFGSRMVFCFFWISLVFEFISFLCNGAYLCKLLVLRAMQPIMFVSVSRIVFSSCMALTKSAWDLLLMFGMPFGIICDLVDALREVGQNRGIFGCSCHKLYE